MRNYRWSCDQHGFTYLKGGIESNKYISLCFSAALLNTKKCQPSPVNSYSTLGYLYTTTISTVSYCYFKAISTLHLHPLLTITLYSCLHSTAISTLQLTPPYLHTIVQLLSLFLVATLQLLSLSIITFLQLSQLHSYFTCFSAANSTLQLSLLNSYPTAGEYTKGNIRAPMDLFKCSDDGLSTNYPHSTPQLYSYKQQ